MKKILLFSLVLSLLSLTTMLFGQRVIPQLNGDRCYFQVANVYFEVDPTYGGRITSLKLDDKEILYTNTGVGMWGSTFWQSPQTWAWPPASSLDYDPYHGGINGDIVSVISNVDNKSNTKLKFRKIFHANLNDTSVTIDYYMVNTGTSAKSFAPWEITRVPVGGMAFFPDSGSITGSLSSAFQKIGNLLWIDYTGANLPGTPNKSFCDGKEGWTAWINSDSAVFIKSFSNISSADAASGEKEVEDYYDSPTSYYEIENQGKFKSINAGDSLKWTMKWYVRKLPDTVDNTKGSVALANFVRRVLAYADTVTIHNSIKKKYYGEKIVLYPNPANKSITISGLTETSNLILTDISGRIVFSTYLEKEQNTISLSRFDEGIYLYFVNSSNTKISGKLIIKN
jgi:hypothetical protein